MFRAKFPCPVHSFLSFNLFYPPHLIYMQSLYTGVLLVALQLNIRILCNPYRLLST